jgi:glyoxylase-like metal-dependent hydrolase (beta-lactamase superfamily II)
MRWGRILLPFLLVGLLGVAALKQGTAQPNSFKKIMDGIWFREGDLANKGHCNNIVIEMKDYLIVVDANFPSGAEECIADIKRVTSKPVRYVFDTHHHGDHAYGNPVWTKMGATTLGHQGVAQEMRRYEPKRWQEAAKEREDCKKQNLDTAEPPRMTFAGNRLVMSDGTRTVEFRFFGWAHTRGDGFVYLPKEKIVCTGDAVVNGPYNYTGDGNSKNWPTVVERVQQLDVETVLPAHGPPADKGLLEGQKQFFLELNKAVDAAIKDGKKLEDIVTKEGEKNVRTSIKLPDKVQNWVAKPDAKLNMYPDQVVHMYRELTEGKPHGEILGGR